MAYNEIGIETENLATGLEIARLGRIRILSFSGKTATSAGVVYTLAASDRPYMSSTYTAALLQNGGTNYPGYVGVANGSVISRYYSPGGTSQTASWPIFAVLVYLTA